MVTKSPLKIQSAMEYLMTYGWAILIIAVVLGVLFSLGVFNSSSLVPQGCIAQSGFYCQDPSFHSGVLTFTFGQFSGQTWGATNIIFVPYGNTVVSTSNPYGTITSLSTGLQSSVSITIPTSVSSSAIGTNLQGTLYASYVLSGGTTPFTIQVAQISVKSS